LCRRPKGWDRARGCFHRLGRLTGNEWLGTKTLDLFVTAWATTLGRFSFFWPNVRPPHPVWHTPPLSGAYFPQPQPESFCPSAPALPRKARPARMVAPPLFTRSLLWSPVSKPPTSYPLSRLTGVYATRGFCYTPKRADSGEEVIALIDPSPQFSMSVIACYQHLSIEKVVGQFRLT